jgi:hypothetical protein
MQTGTDGEAGSQARTPRDAVEPRRDVRRLRRVPCALVAAVAAVILVLTLAPVDALGGTESLSLTLRFRGFRGLADSIANLLLFVPFGIAAAACLRGRLSPVIAGLALSLVIELAQLVIPGRYTSLWDVLFNTAGAAVGVAVLRTAPAWLRPAGPLRFVLPVTAFAAALIVLIGGATLFAPRTLPGLLIGQWTHAFVGSPSYDGRILEAHVGRFPVLPRRVADSDSVRAALFRDTLDILVRAGPPPDGRAPLFAVAAPHYQTLLSVAIEGEDVIVGYRMRAYAIGLDQPTLRVPGALAGITQDETFRFRLWWQGADRCVEVDGAARCGLGFSADDTWALLLYPVRPPLQGTLPYLWTAALLLPAGFWIRRSAVAVLAAAAAVLALAAAPAFVTMLPPGGAVLAAAATGLLAGHAIRLAIER